MSTELGHYIESDLETADILFPRITLPKAAAPLHFAAPDDGIRRLPDARKQM